MAENSKIEWTDHTFNPWIGCQKVSPGCDHCYAEALMDKRYGKVEWGPHGERKRTSEANWKLPLKWAKAARFDAARFIGPRPRPRVFCASLADWLDNQVPTPWRADLLELIDYTPELDWLLLTKRPENYQRLIGHQWPKGPPANVWLGVTAEDQDNYRRRWRFLSQLPAAVRFISYEPAIGPLDLDILDVTPRLPDWVICGGESGPGARQMNEGWARDVKLQCEKLGVSFFMKQMTGKKPVPDYLMVREFPRPRP